MVVKTVKKKLRFSDVYTDSEDETISEQTKILAKKIRPGVLILIKLVAEGKSRKEYRYAAICQSSAIELEGEVQVKYLKMVGKDAKVFICNEDDVYDVALENIVSILPDPILKNKGDRTYYNFTNKIDILEK